MRNSFEDNFKLSFLGSILKFVTFGVLPRAVDLFLEPVCSGKRALGAEFHISIDPYLQTWGMYFAYWNLNLSVRWS
jgi:hypothetical protein